MKIIELNNRIECGECGCLFEYEGGDVKHEVKSELRVSLLLTRDYYNVYYVECPICKRKHVINKQFKYAR